MTYNDKYDAMPLRGKVSVNGWSLEVYGISDWGAERSRRYGRKHHRHYDPLGNWWKDCDIGVSYRHHKNWWKAAPGKGHKRKTWRDYNYGRSE